MDIKQHAPQFEKAIEHFKSELAGVRTNRATPAMLENIMTEVYGQKMPIMQLASIQAPEPTMMTVEPWDKSTIKAIEKAISSASLGLSVSNEGTFLRITVSPLMEETRKELLKMVNTKTEEARRSLRGVRDEIKEKILAAEKDKEISEDERYKLVEELDKMTRNYNDKVNALAEKKEGEIRI